MKRRLFLFLFLLLAACGGDPAPASPDTLSAATDSSAADAGAEDGEGIDEVSSGCEPGAVTCVDEASWAACDEAGELGEAVACEVGTGCVAGHCRSPLCTPGEVRCVSWTRRRTCESGGARWGDAVACGVDEICHTGKCLTCFPGEPTCATLAASTVCADDGLTFPMDTIAPCEAGQSCHEPSGNCLETACAANETTCAGALGTHECLASGTDFSPEITPCDPGETCASASCAEAACPPQPVLFVVDRTGAFDEDWDAYRSGIEAATAAHPGALYGFMPFPMAFGCPEPGAGDLPRFPIQADADVNEWFDTVPKSAGKAALQRVLQVVLDRAQEIFAGNGGRLVLISSGSADCDSDADTIGALVTALRLDHGVRTFVIGHRASAGFYPALDAAHAQGGSGWADWKETSFDLDVAAAMQAALEDLPPCDASP